MPVNIDVEPMPTAITAAKALRASLARGEACFGAQLGLIDPSVAEIFAQAGYDWLVLDAEHGPHTPATITSAIQATAGTRAAVLARPRRLDPDDIRLFLDIGAAGILCPQISSAESARMFVEACRYPPLGRRGFGPRRAAGFGRSAQRYFDEANASVLCLAIVESIAGVDAIDEIVASDGLDGVVIGPVDLSIDLGHFREFDHPSFIGSVDRVRNACLRQGLAVGTGCYSVSHAKESVAAGDQLLLVTNDDSLLATESARLLSELRDGSVSS
jgi:2-keto-3-deoxy-L-rhamnonate aldolase RhmA